MAAILIFAITYLVLAIGRLPGFRIDRTGAAIIGASFSRSSRQSQRPASFWRYRLFSSPFAVSFSTPSELESPSSRSASTAA